MNKLYFLFAAFLTLGSTDYAHGTQLEGLFLHNKDAIPIAGRGYSAGTGDVYARCIKGSETEDNTAFTVDHDLQIIEIGGEATYADDLKPIRETASYYNIRHEIEKNYEKTDTERSKNYNRAELRFYHHIVVLGHSHGYYSNIGSELTKKSKKILKGGGIIPFVQACGPSYIGSVVTSREVAMIFIYMSSRPEPSVEFNKFIREMVQGGSFEDKFNSGAYGSYSRTLDVKLFTHGVPYKGEKFDRRDIGIALKKSMDSFLSTDSGVVKSVQLFPWSQNSSFLKSSGFVDAVIEIGVSNTNAGTADVITLSMASKKYNFQANTDFIAQLDVVLKKKSNMVLQLQQCYHRLLRTPAADQDKQVLNRMTEDLKPESTKDYKYEDEKTIVQKDYETITVKRLSKLLGPEAQDVVTGQLMSYFNNFYNNCMKQLNLAKNGFLGGKMLEFHWLTVDTCNIYSCLVGDPVWLDQPEGGGTGYCQKAPEDQGVIRLVNTYCQPEVVNKYFTEVVQKPAIKRENVMYTMSLRSQKLARVT